MVFIQEDVKDEGGHYPYVPIYVVRSPKKTAMKNHEKKNKDHLGAGGVIIRSRVCVAGRS